MDGESGRPYALTFARLMIGSVAVIYGIATTFKVFGGIRFDRLSGMAASADVPTSVMYSWICLALLIIGVALVVGVFARIGALLLLIVILWHAIADSRFTAFFVANNGCEYLLALAALCLIVITHGPGPARVRIQRDPEQQATPPTAPSS